MEKKTYEKHRQKNGLLFKVLAQMKLTVVFLILTMIQVKAERSYAQNLVTLSEKNSPLIKVFKQIKRQTGFSYVLNSQLLEQSPKINIEVRNVTLTYALDLIFRDQPLTYEIVGKTIVVKERGEVKKVVLDSSPPREVRGKVTTEEGEPIFGANITVRGTNKIVTTDQNGEFVLTDVDENAVIEITYVGYERRTISIRNHPDRSMINTSLGIASKELDIAIVQAYGTTTKRSNAGNIAKITSDVISKQPVSNPLMALSGRVPGMTTVQSGGLPGSPVKIEIRGRSVIDRTLSNNEPLFVIDGVPYAPGNNVINTSKSALGTPEFGGGLSAFNMINTADIESIEILKDADATAIYGSRGANGVVLVTTKKGKAGKTRIEVNLSKGFSKVTRTPDLMNTQQYLQMRREAFSNDGIIPTLINAPDLLLYDTTRYVDHTDYFIGGTAKTTFAQLGISGGNANTKFLASGTFFRETTVFPGDLFDKKGSLHVNLNHISSDKKFFFNFTGNYTADNNNLIVTDLTTNLFIAPNYPSFFDSSGNLAWTYKGLSLNGNPLAYLFQKYIAKTNNFLGNIYASYKLMNDLNLKVSAGANFVTTDDVRTIPKSSDDPASNPLGFAEYGNNSFKSWIIEPQIEYHKLTGVGKINILVGGSFQNTENQGMHISAFGFSNDALLQYASAASNKTVSTNFNEHKYRSVFGRLNYNFRDKYILNVSGRRDGTSRFGPAKQYANFGAVGTAWIFSAEKFISDNLSFLSYGKIRASYGTSGNDGSGNYQYLNNWSATTYPYQSVQGLYPSALFNETYQWETNKKFETGLELGTFNDRILLSVSYYKNHSSNQLVSQPLPTQTGFTSITTNFPALVENTGVEITLHTVNIQNKDFKWVTYGNLTKPKNKLLDFPGLSTSPYANVLEVGQPLNIYGGYRFLGVDQSTGIFSFEDLNKDGQINSADRIVNLGSLDPKLYGAFGSTFTYNSIELDVFFEFKKQIGRNYLSNFFYPAGYGTINYPIEFIDRWKKAGDITSIQKLTASTGTPAYNAWANLFQPIANNGKYSDASYIRLKNVSLAYKLPSRMLNKVRMETGRIYINAQNLFTFTDYKGSDPESQNMYALPPLRTIVMGIQLII